MQAKTVKQ